MHETARIPTQAEYEAREAQLFRAQLAAVDAAPLADRKAAAAEYREALTTEPGRIAQTVEFILSGAFGFGPYKAARAIITNHRMNRRAIFAQYAAALEFQTTAADARTAWKNATPAQQAEVDRLIDAEIDSAEADLIAEQAEK